MLSNDKHQKVPQGIALRLQQISDTTEKYELCADKYKIYLLERHYKPSLADEHFKKIGKISKGDARKINLKLIRSVKSNFQQSKSQWYIK